MRSTWKKRIACVAGGVSVAWIGAAPAAAADPNDFLVFNHVTAGTTDLRGRLLVPTGHDPSKSYPLVLYLDGLGGAGTDNESQISGSMNNLIKNARNRGFFIYAPQSINGWWGMDNNLPVVMKTLAEIGVQYNIDEGKVFATGLSSGGGGTVLLAVTQSVSDVFAGFVPLSPSGSAVSGAGAQRLVDRPTWFYAARNDGTYTAVARDSTKNITLAQGGPSLSFPLNSAGNPNYNNGAPYYSDGSTYFQYNQVRHTEYVTGGHTSATWGRAYNENQLYDWMFSQDSGITAPVSGRPVSVDFSNKSGATAIDTAGNTWNTAGATGYTQDYRSPGVTVGFAKDHTGARTSMHLRVTQRFVTDANSASGVGTVPDGITVLDASAVKDYWAAGHHAWLSDPSVRIPSSLAISGLTPGETYDLKLFASVGGNDGGRGFFGSYVVRDALGDHEIVFNAANNLTQFVGGAGFGALIADANGELSLTITPVNGSRYALLNTLHLTAVPEPAGLAALAGAAWIVARRRRR